MAYKLSVRKVTRLRRFLENANVPVAELQAASVSINPPSAVSC